MTTIKDATELIGNMEYSSALFGATEEWVRQVRDMTLVIGTSIMEEQGLSREQASQLPPETELGPKAEAAYQQLKSFYNTSTSVLD
ncbi:hypothetical protein KJ910_00370 [Patescibacteria group bacterium]|nr:hypothetical protein [Patescibacteria group bacterium]MBU1906638.1 hypothetical protein [Patescibacteria group bacterium]